jgi:glucoamylase
MQPETYQRYAVDDMRSNTAFWRFDYPCGRIAHGQTLRIEVNARAVVHWTQDSWETVNDTLTRDTGIGVHIADLPTSDLPAGTNVQFTFCWSDANRWEGQNFSVTIEGT